MVLSSVCLCLSVCFYILSVFTALWQINVFIISSTLLSPRLCSLSVGANAIIILVNFSGSKIEG